MSGGKRRLAGILAADVVGYSAMVAADEPASLARVRALRTDIIEPAATAHDGRLFKTLGDGFLLEFASAVQALRCAIAIQTALNTQGDGLHLRIGVHQGEVVPEGDDLFTRLEPLAEPGGIVISARVRRRGGDYTAQVSHLKHYRSRHTTAQDSRPQRCGSPAPCCGIALAVGRVGQRRALSVCSRRTASRPCASRSGSRSARTVRPTVPS
jgi:class 3 adenylate cyclase